jgi:transcriptional regulator with XRE-family HTH domain
MSTIGERFRKFGLYYYGSVKKFAEVLETDASNLQKYLNDQREPGTIVLLRVASLGCDLNWLLTGKIHRRKTQIIERINKALLKNKMSVDDLKKIVSNSWHLDLSDNTLMSFSQLSSLCWEFSIKKNLDFYQLYFGFTKKELLKWRNKNFTKLSQPVLGNSSLDIIMDMQIKFGFTEDEAKQLLDFSFHNGLSEETFKIIKSKEDVSNN